MTTKPICSFKEFLQGNHPLPNNNIATQNAALVPMDLDSQNPATHRLIRHSARRVILQHQKEIQALKDK